MADRFNRSECKIVKVNYIWYDVQVPFLQTTDGNEESIESPLFSSGEIPDSQWKLVIFDGGTKLDIRAYRIVNSNRIKDVDPELLKVSIINEGGNPFRHQHVLAFHPAGCEIPKSQVSLHSNGSLRFNCTILVLVPKNEHISSTDPNSIVINCSDGLSSQFQEIFDGMQLSDVNINIGGREFLAHKLILAARSKPFAAMFGHPTKEKLTNQITIEDIEPEVFQELLRFIYTGRVNLSTMQSMGVGLLIAADKYLLEDLKIECEEYLLCKLSPMNCLEILLNENLPGSSEQLKKEAVNFFRRQPEKVMATDQWKKLKKENPTLLCDIQEFIFCSE